MIARRDMVRKDGKCALSIQVFINKKRKVISLGAYVRPDDFDSTRQLVNGEDPEMTSAVNAIIHKSKSRAEKIFYRAILDDRPLTADRFAEMFLARSSRNDFYEFLEVEISRAKGHMADGTVKNYRKLLRRLKDFRPTLLMSDIDYNLVESFDRLMSRKGYEVNTKWTYHKDLRKMINLARNRGHRIEQPYGKFKIQKAKTQPTFLTPDELRTLVDIYELNSLSPGRHKVLRYFLFQCFTSLRISEVKALTDDHILHDTLVFRPLKSRKSRMVLKVPLSDFALRLIEDSRLEHDGEQLFDCISDQKNNEKLKEIAEFAGIRKRITSHVGRHTFATLFLGGDVQVLKDIMGHSKDRDNDGVCARYAETEGGSGGRDR